MTLQIIRLDGCTSRPLAAYLKGLGVFRILAEQRDPNVRAFWRDDTLHLATSLSADELLDFFLHAWEPSPFVSPWNKGSGFFNAVDKGLAPVERSTAARFARLREGIGAARRLTESMDAAVQAERAVKEESKGLDAAAREAMRADPEYKQRLAAAARRAKALKDQLQPECQKVWRGDALRWLRAAVVLDDEGGASFPGLLGTGGNDGKLDFTNNAMQRIADLFDLSDPRGAPRTDARPRLEAALLGVSAPGLVKGGIGQFAPGDSGGANAGSGPLADSRLNPWDLPLLLEGALLFAASSNRRLLGRDQPRVAAPFVVRNRAVGAATAVAGEESSRGEQWMPLWERPWSATELSAVLGEGRAQVGARTGQDPLDMMRAVARLGVARGITAFERYGFMERNGKSNYAVPLGRQAVEANPRAALIDDLERADWLGRLQREVRKDRAPASVAALERRLSDLMFAALRHGDEGPRWRAVAVALAQVEAALVRSEAWTARARLGPIPPLGAGWWDAIGDDAESRLALALARAGGPSDRDGVRAHWLPDRTSPTRFASGPHGLRLTTRMVVTGRDPEGDLVALVQRRLVEAETGAARTLPLPGVAGNEARLSDLAAFVAGGIDVAAVLWLARALAAIDPRAAVGPTAAGASRLGELDPAWMVLRLVHLAWPLEPGRRIPVDPAVARLLAAGEGGRAMTLAQRRLGAAGVRSPLQAAVLAPATARRMAASLAFPISPRGARTLAVLLDPSSLSPASEAHHVH